VCNSAQEDILLGIYEASNTANTRPESKQAIAYEVSGDFTNALKVFDTHVLVCICVCAWCMRIV